jgi:hypothetical protein
MIRINYYPPRGDNKESWDNVDIVGWLNYSMQIKVNFLCRDSIFAPLCLIWRCLSTLRSEPDGRKSRLAVILSSMEDHKENDLFLQLSGVEILSRDGDFFSSASCASAGRSRRPEMLYGPASHCFSKACRRSSTAPKQAATNADLRQREHQASARLLPRQISQERRLLARARPS